VPVTGPLYLTIGRVVSGVEHIVPAITV